MTPPRRRNRQPPPPDPPTTEPSLPAAVDPNATDIRPAPKAPLPDPNATAVGPAPTVEQPAATGEPGATDEQPAPNALAATDEQPPMLESANSTDEQLPAALDSANSTGELPPAREPGRRGGRAPVRGGGSRPGQPKRGVRVTVLLLAALAVGGAVAWKQLAGGSAPTPPRRDDALEAASLAFQEAKNLVRKGQWKLAREQLEAAERAAPELPGLLAYLDAAQVEVPLQEHLDAAAAALDRSELARAAKELAAVPDTTQQLARRQELKKRLELVADQRLKEARALASDRTRMKQLKALAEDVLAARPNDRDALRFLETANRALGWKAPVEKPPEPSDPANEVMARWAAGDASAAFAKAEACAGSSARCAKLRDQVARASEQLKQLESLEEAELLELVRLDKALAGGAPSARGQQAGVRLAAVLTPKASSAAARKQWGAAMQTARRILEGDPGNAAAKNVISEGRAAADELYRRCYVARQSTPEDAVALCREVVEMLPVGDALREKAERLLEAR